MIPPDNSLTLRIEATDPQGGDALTLLHEAAVEARLLYPELFTENSPWPTNPSTPDRGVYLLAYQGSVPVACGALRPIDDDVVEVRRVYVLEAYRRRGVARQMLHALELEASRLKYRVMRLETGYRQIAAMRLYESYGFIRIPSFGPHSDDPTSVCYEKPVDPLASQTPFSRVFAGYEYQLPQAFREQFLVAPESEQFIRLEGRMHRIWHRPVWLKPVFALLGMIGVLVPRIGQDIPTRLVVLPGRLPDGQPYHEYRRTFDFNPPVRFNTRLVFDPWKGALAEQAGAGRFLHMVWKAQFIPPRSLTLETAAYAIRFGERRWYIPDRLWPFLFGRVRFIQQARPGGERVSDVDLRIHHPLFGEIFGYTGAFKVIKESNRT
jgi:GNAT superfamily N-acetyltransferase